MKRAVLIFIFGCLFVAMSVLPVAAAGGNGACPDGTFFVAKYEARGSSFDFEEGEDVISITGNLTSGTWSSSIRIAALIIKGGPGSFVQTYSGQGVTAGSYSNASLPPVGQVRLNQPDISNMVFCSREKETNPSSMSGARYVIQNEF